MYGFGVYEVARTRHKALTVGGQAVNQLHHRRTRSTPKDRSVTSPNIDTLYSSAFLDLSGGPVELRTPDAPLRYHNIAIMNAFTDNIAYFGSRTNGGTAGGFWIVGLDWNGSAPSDAELVRTDTNDVWLLGRTLVAGPSDLDAALAVQDEISIAALAQEEAELSSTQAIVRAPDAETFLRVVNETLGRSPVTIGQAQRASRFRACGIQPGNLNAWLALNPQEQELWTSQLPILLDNLRRRTRRSDVEDGAWRKAPPGVGNFQENDELRARIALSGLGALSAEEATYFLTARDTQGQPLDGSRAYKFTLPPGGVRPTASGRSRCMR